MSKKGKNHYKRSCSCALNFAYYLYKCLHLEEMKKEARICKRSFLYLTYKNTFKKLASRQ